jgi:hypothetical protein
MSRLEKRGKGSILLLHDIHPATVAALPGLLKELKDRGYHIVQVVAPAPAEPETVGGPEVWPQASGLPDQIINNGAPAAAWRRAPRVGARPIELTKMRDRSRTNRNPNAVRRFMWQPPF